jgi:hypothetical protein
MPNKLTAVTSPAWGTADALGRAFVVACAGADLAQANDLALRGADVAYGDPQQASVRGGGRPRYTAW